MAPVERLVWVFWSEGVGDAAVVVVVVAGRGGVSEVEVGFVVLDMDVGVEVLAVEVEDVVEVVERTELKLFNVTDMVIADGT